MSRFYINQSKDKDVEIMSVSDVSCLFGIWKDLIPKKIGKKIVVLNTRNHRVVGAFQLIEVPFPLKQRCPCCFGKGEIDLKVEKV